MSCNNLKAGESMKRLVKHLQMCNEDELDTDHFDEELSDDGTCFTFHKGFGTFGLIGLRVLDR